MNSTTLRALAVSLGAAAASACGGSSGNGADAATPPDSSTPRDAGHTDTGRADTGHADAGHSGSGHPDAADAEPEAAFDAGAPDCGPLPPTGNQLVASTDPLILQGGRLTSDDYAFYLDANTQDLFVIAAAGGTPTNLGTMTSQSDTFWLNGGKAALFLTAPCNPETLLAPLWVWTAAAGAKEISKTAFSWDSFNYTYDAKKDGSEVAYFTTPGNYTAALNVVTLDTGVTQTLVQNINLTSQACWPFVQFVGDTVVAYYCETSGDNVGPLTIASFAGANYTQTTIATFATPSDNAPLEAPAAISPATSPGGATHLLVTPAQGASGVALYPIAGGAPVPLSATGQQAAFVPDGDVLVLDSNGALLRFTPPVPVPDAGSTDAAAPDGGAHDAAGASDAGGPITLVGSSASLEGILALSTDGNWLQVFTQYTDVDPYPTNIAVASTTTPGAPATAWTPATASALGFTADSKFEVFVAPTADGGAYELGASSVSGGSLVTVPAIAVGPAFTSTSRFIVGVNGNSLTGSADLKAVDLADPTAATTLVSQADPNYFYTGGSDAGGPDNQLLYSWHCAATKASGVWALTAP